MPTSKHWTTEPDGEVNIKTTLSGPASIPPVTVNEAFKQVVRRFGFKTALRVKRNGDWVCWSYKQYYSDVSRAAKSMIRLGLEPHRGVCILGFNSPEWFISFLGAIMAGGVGCGIYTTNAPDACHYIADNCSANIIVCENKMQLDKILKVRDRLPHVKALVQYSSEPVDPQQRDQGVISWEEFMNIGKDLPDYEVQWRIEQQKPGQCCSLIYTSGTTGPPKGVMISHDNCTWTAGVCCTLYGLDEDDEMISYLPLSHIAAQMMDIVTPLLAGLTISFAQPDALKGSLAGTLKEVRPTVFVAVPRVWEKFRDTVELALKEAKGFKETILRKAKSVGKQTSLNRQKGEDVAWGFWLANLLVFKGLRTKMGLDRCRIQGTAAAPISRQVIDFFLDFDIPLYELYGMSECSGPQAVSFIGSHKIGSVGKVMPGVEMKIDNPAPNGDGEICMRGRHVFMGYLMEERKTKETVDEEGWLHSGDIGKVDDEGFVYITGRLKEILITRGGENVAPVPIENKMKAEMKLLSNCVVIGDNQRYLTMFVTLRCEINLDENKPTDNVDVLGISILQEIGSTATTVSEAREDPKVLEYIKQGMGKANKFAVSNSAVVKKFMILPSDLSISGGELTPTLKIKRRIVLEKYADLVEEIYRE